MKQSLAFVPFVVACGRPLVSVESGETIAGDSSSTSTSETSTSETSTSTSETSTESTTESGELPGFVPPFDAPLSNECDIFMQDCPDGEKCVPYAGSSGYFDAYKCVPVLGEQSPGEPCTYTNTADSTDDCDATSFCWDSHCYLFCTGSPDDPECPPGSDCLTGSDFSIFVCITTCDPLLQDCDDGFACHWNDGFICTATTLDVPAGESCEVDDDCTAGTNCIDAAVLPSCADAYCCTPYCTLGEGDLPCAVVPGTTCVPFFEDGQALPGYEQVGVCLVPP